MVGLTQLVYVRQGCEAAPPLLEDQTFEIALLAPAGERFVKLHRAIRVLALEKALPRPLAVVVAGGTGVLIVLHEALAGDLLYPLGLRVAGGLHRRRFAIFHLGDDVGDMGGLSSEHVGEVRSETGLREAHVKQVWEAVA